MSCRRHVDVRARACPFCGAALASATRSTASTVVGRVSRAAVFTGLAACWTTNPPDRQLPSMPPNQQPGTGDGAVIGHPVSSVSLTGRVVEQSSGSPLQNAVVELHDQGGRVGQTNTDADGRYRFDGLKPDDYQVVVRYNAAAAVGSAQLPVSVRDAGATLDVQLQVVMRSYLPKPYGAPPARRRTV